jgi:hypothetical protein
MPDPTFTWLFSALRRYVASQRLFPIQNSEEPTIKLIPLTSNKLARHTHDSGLSLGLKLTHCFMLMTWLFSVSRSMRAAVR